jgi:hypothetical protein
MSGHLADLWGDLVEQERKIKNDKDKLKTLILTSGLDVIRGSNYSISILTITSDRFDSDALKKYDPIVFATYRKKVKSTRIDLV